MFFGKVHNLSHFCLGDLISVDTADADAAAVDMHHDARGFVAIFLKEAFQDVNDEFHWRVVVIQHEDLVHRRLLGFGARLDDDAGRGAAIAIALIENIQRENLNPVEEAMALQRLIDEFGMTHQQTAESVGRSRAAVTNLLRLLTLNHDVRQMLEEGKMDMGHARALLALTGKAQSDAGRQVVDKGLSVRETEQLVRRLTERPHAPKAAHAKDPDIRALEEKLADRLGARVVIQHAGTGKGKLIIEYHSMDELDGILARIK